MPQTTKTIIVKASPEYAFRVWEDFENFPQFMKNVKNVTLTGDGTSHWEVAGPMGKTLHWDAEITRLEPNQRIGWSTKDHEGDVTTSGQVTFTPLTMGDTQVTVTMQYEPKGGATNSLAANLFADPGEELEKDLNNFKNYVEGMDSRIA